MREEYVSLFLSYFHNYIKNKRYEKKNISDSVLNSEDRRCQVQKFELSEFGVHEMFAFEK